MSSGCMEQIVSYNNQISAIDSLLLNLDKKKELARILIASNLIPRNLDTPEKVLVCLFKAQEMGIPPMEALSSMPVINNKVTLQGNLILSLINRSHNVKEMKIDSKETFCSVFMSRKDYEMSFTAQFSLDDAKKAGLLEKQIWKQYTKLMLQWRAVAICARIVFPDIMSGLYTPEEIACSIDENVPVAVDQNGDVVVLDQKNKNSNHGQSNSKKSESNSASNGNSSDNKQSDNSTSQNNISGHSNDSTAANDPESDKEHDRVPVPDPSVISLENNDQSLHQTNNQNDVSSMNDNMLNTPYNMQISDIFSAVKKLLDEGNHWNGKIYKGNAIYINNKKYILTDSEIDELKEFTGQLALREMTSSKNNSLTESDDLPF